MRIEWENGVLVFTNTPSDSTDGSEKTAASAFMVVQVFAVWNALKMKEKFSETSVAIYHSK